MNKITTKICFSKFLYSIIHTFIGVIFKVEKNDIERIVEKFKYLCILFKFNNIKTLYE
jgi:hypothetical protein